MSRAQFSFITTEDGSPTVRFILGAPASSDVNDSGAGERTESEAMHSLKGAFSETLYIYGTALELAFERGFEPRVLSLGLGLGYVEVLAAALCLKREAAVQERFYMESFESAPELRDWFRSFVTEDGSADLPEAFTNLYQEILERTANHVGVEARALKAFLARLLQENRWRLREALTAETSLGANFGCICFDAFSSKTSPELWTEEFLVRFLAKACASGSVLSTYACTGALKRSLRGAGFQVEIREGFSSKRDSTFAVRLEFPSAIADEKA